MTAETIVFVAAGIFALLILSTTLLRYRLGFVASAAWTMFPVYGSLLPEGGGLMALVGALLAIALVIAIRRRQRFWIPAGLVAGIVLAAIVVIRELIDPPVLSTQGIQLLVSIVAAALVCYVGRVVRWGEGFALGLLPGGVTLAIAELLRVGSGGSVHSAEVAFGINPIVLGQYAAVAAVVVAFQIFRGMWKWPVWIIFVVATGGVVATGSRGPLLGLALAVVYLLLRPNASNSGAGFGVLRMVGVAFTGILGALLVLSLNADIEGWLRIDDQDQNADSRVEAWRGAWATIANDGLWGAGPGRYFESGYGPTFGLPEYPHNMFLEVWSEYGLVAVVVLGTVVAAAWRGAGHRGEVFVILAVTIASFSGSLGTSLVFWMAIGLALSTSAISEGLWASMSRTERPSDEMVTRPHRDGTRDSATNGD